MRTSRFLSHPLLLAVLLLMLTPGIVPDSRAQETVTIARLHYGGGGDWYGNRTSLANLLREMRERIGVPTTEEEAVVEPGDPSIFQYPMLYMAGHGTVRFTESEVQNLRTYFDRGGLLWADDDFGMDESFRREMAKVFPNQEWIELPFDHPIYETYYSFESGLPKVHEHAGGPPQLLAIYHQGRAAVLYTFNTDISDGIESEGIHPQDPPDVRDQAMQFAVNLMLFALTR